MPERNNLQWNQNEMMEFLLSGIIAKSNINRITYELMHTFDSIENIMNASYGELRKIKGISRAAAIYLHFLGDFNRIYPYINYMIVSMKTPEERSAYCKEKLTSENKYEVFLVVCLNQTMQVKQYCKLQTGTCEGVHVDLQKILRFVLSTYSDTIVIAHNHPVGNAFPSYEDIKQTKFIKQFLKTVNIQLLDHIIVAQNSTYSMAEHGQI